MKATIPNQPGSVSARNHTPTETILVVDDYPELCTIASLFLRRCGYRVLTASNGEQAKQIAREHADIDLLLTDVEMPGMLGDKLADWFRVTRPNTAIVFMSGNPMQQRRLEPCHFVEKPFIHFDALRKTVHTALEEKRTTPETTSAAA